MHCTSTVRENHPQDVASFPLNQDEDQCHAPQKVLLIISVQPTEKIRADVAAGHQPRRDYDALRELLNAEMLCPDEALKTRTGRSIARIFGVRAALTWTAFHRHRRYDVLYTDTEVVGLPLALLLKLGRARSGKPRHVTLSHYLTPLKKRLFFKIGVGSHIDTIIVHGAAQRALAMQRLHVSGERIVKLPYFVDEHFWHPPVPVVPDSRDVTTSVQADTDQPPMIFVPGLECRDFPTLLKAVEGMNVQVQVTAASAAAFHLAALSSRYQRKNNAHMPTLPSNVAVGSYDYAGVRRMYTEARFVVVPLRECDFPAGITVILEAMAMGKAVIATGTSGQTDVLRDPRNDGRGQVVRQWWPGYLDVPGLAETLGQLPTGFYVTPGDPDDLRDRIQYLLEHPEVAEEFGRNGRRVVEAFFGLDAFAQRFAKVIRGREEP